MGHRQTQSGCLIEFISSRHDNQNVYVAVVVRRSIGIRTEKDDFLRLETFGKFPRKSVN